MTPVCHRAADVCLRGARVAGRFHAKQLERRIKQISGSGSSLTAKATKLPSGAHPRNARAAARAGSPPAAADERSGYGAAVATAPLLVVDGPSMLFRAFYALPKSIKGADGKPVNALLGTANLILREVEEHAPRAVVLCFGPDAADYRVELFDGYHADRPPVPDELASQFADCEDFFGAFGWTVATHDSLEADDLLNSYARREEAAGGHALLLTGDRDMFQCAGPAITVLYVSTGVSGGAEVDAAEVKRRYGIPPELVPDFIALRGDPSDGIPGAKGVGAKTAAELLRKHGSLEGVLDAAFREPRPKLRTALTGARDELLAFREIAALREEKVRRPRDKRTDFRSAAKAAEERGMNRLAERLRKAA
jgi:5'-3' exonuclease